MDRNARTKVLVAMAAAALLLTGCGGDSDEETATTEGTGAPTDDAATGSGADDPGAGSDDMATDDGAGGVSSGGSGTLVLDGESIDLRSVLCTLESQPSAGGGGNILFVVQGEGLNAAGESVMIDVSRYDEESMFAGDDVQVYVGDVTTGEATEMFSTTPAGTVTQEGTSARVDDLTLEDPDTLSEHSVSFDIDC